MRLDKAPFIDEADRSIGWWSKQFDKIRFSQDLFHLFKGLKCSRVELVDVFDWTQFPLLIARSKSSLQVNHPYLQRFDLGNLRWVEVFAEECGHHCQEF